MTSNRILIIDDHSAVRIGLKQMLNHQSPKMNFDEAATAAEALRKIELFKWDLIILDINLPDQSGLEVLRQLKIEKINTPVLVFSFHKEDLIAIRAFRLGAAGYIAKDADDTEFHRAIKLCLAGKKYISQDISDQLVRQLENPTLNDPHEELSDREFQTFLLLASGLPLAQIAQKLFLSQSTVHTYRTRVLEKMEMKSNADLIRYALNKNLI